MFYVFFRLQGAYRTTYLQVTSMAMGSIMGGHIWIRTSSVRMDIDDLSPLPLHVPDITYMYIIEYVYPIHCIGLLKVFLCTTARSYSIVLHPILELFPYAVRNIQYHVPSDPCFFSQAPPHFRSLLLPAYIVFRSGWVFYCIYKDFTWNQLITSYLIQKFSSHQPTFVYVYLSKK